MSVGMSWFMVGLSLLFVVLVYFVATWLYELLERGYHAWRVRSYRKALDREMAELTRERAAVRTGEWRRR